jgi:hypothetical protein
MRLRFGVIPLAMLPLAACGGGEGRVTVRGDFADSARAPTTVFAVEAEREAEVNHGTFTLRGLSAGPATLRLVRGTDTVGVLTLNSLPGGSTVELRRLRVDEATHLAFPETVGLTGPDLVMLNGVRMGREARVPAQVDAPGRVLAISPRHDALLLRPDDGALPDLRVVIGFATETVTPDGDAVEIGRVRAGDSIRVQGRGDQGFVVATRLIVPGDVSAAPAEDEPVADARPEDPPRAEERVAEDAPAREARQPRQTATPVRPPRAVREVIGQRGHGRGHGRGRAKEGKH